MAPAVGDSPRTTGGGAPPGVDPRAAARPWYDRTMSKPSIAGNLDARDLRLFLAGQSRSAKLSQLALGEIGGQAGNLTYRAERLTFRDLRSAADASAPEGTAAGWASADDVELDFGTFQLRADRLEFPSGIRFEGKREVIAPEAKLENLTLHIDDFAAFGSSGDSEVEDDAEKDASAEDARPGGLAGIEDWSFLDAIDGHINVDLFVDTTVPLLGRRRATHHFRIPIERGTVDYRGIEDNLHWLEDAFLDIEVIDGKLVLEQDLPLVPFRGKALVWWNLSAKELELARQRRVKLRTLLSPEMPSQPAKKKKASVTFHQFALRNVDIDLSLRRDTELVIGRVAKVALGEGGRPGLVELKLGGDLQYHMRRTLEPTSVGATLHRLTAGETGLYFKPVTVTAAGVELGPIDSANMGLQGIVPSWLTARLVSATIRDLRVAF